jgi:hypothetical protein
MYSIIYSLCVLFAVMLLIWNSTKKQEQKQFIQFENRDLTHASTILQDKINQ